MEQLAGMLVVPEEVLIFFLVVKDELVFRL